MIDVVILTESKYANISGVPEDEYTRNVMLEDDLLKKALEKQGLVVARKDWNDSKMDWSSTHSIIFRSTWDYFHKYNLFKPWLDKVAKQTRLFNSVNQILWNMDKHYLNDLEALNINVPKSYFIEAGTSVTLARLFNKYNLDEAVLKPCISGAGRHTYKLNKENLFDYENTFQTLVNQEAMMLQPFLKYVPIKGEVSYMILGGKYTHAIQKKAKSGDFRVQDDFGGSVQEYQPSKNEIQFAEQTVAQLDTMPAYARVDVVWDNDDALCIGELELIEPELWFRHNVKSADVLAKHIASELCK